MNPYIPIDLIALLKFTFIHGYSKKQVELLTSIHKEVMRQIEKSNEAYKKQKDKSLKNYSSYKVGDLIWIRLTKDYFPGTMKTKAQANN